MPQRPGPSDEEPGEMTLAFDVTAISALLDPKAVFADARTWSTHVGIVGNDASLVNSLVATYDLKQDYTIGDLDKAAVLSKLRWEANTERYVYLGTADDHEELADHVDWEYYPIEEAARKADWLLHRDARFHQRLSTGIKHYLLR